VEAEVDGKIGAEKSEQVESRQGYRPSYRMRRFDTRMGMMYYMVPKILNDDEYHGWHATAGVPSAKVIRRR